MRLLGWLKTHKALTFLIIVAVWFVFQVLRIFLGVGLTGRLSRSSTFDSASDLTSGTVPFGAPLPATSEIQYNFTPETAPQGDVKNRLVIKESNLSLLVEDVSEANRKMLEHVNKIGGYMVTSGIYNPDDTPTSTLVIRVPANELDKTLEYFHSLSVKVVSENLTGRDVTDQYVDIDARLATLENTKKKFEEILAKATLTTDITNLTREILNIQSQIDALKGQQDFLIKNAQMAKLTIYLSTDEITLPYAPGENFRPKVIFKLAVRSLVENLRDIATFLIWVGVYSVIWLPVLGVIYFVRRRVRTKNTSK